MTSAIQLWFRPFRMLHCVRGSSRLMFASIATMSRAQRVRAPIFCPPARRCPAALFNPAALSYLNQIYNKLPLPTGANYSLTSAALNTSDFRQEILKIDHNFTDTWSAFYRFENDKIPTLEANSLFSSGGSLPGVSTTETDSPGKTHTFQTTFTISPSMILEARYAHAYGAILSKNVGLLALTNSTNPVTLAVRKYS